jgi:hypothetical protein
VKEPSLSDLSLAVCPYLAPISSKNCATVSASLDGTALISTSFRKLSIATSRYRFPFLSSVLNTIKSYETSKKGLETIKECLVFILSLSPLTFWQIGQDSIKVLRSACSVSDSSQPVSITFTTD